MNFQGHITFLVMTLDASDYEQHSDTESSVSDAFDVKLERNYEKVKMLIDRPLVKFSVVDKRPLSKVNEQIKSSAVPEGLSYDNVGFSVGEKFLPGWKSLNRRETDAVTDDVSFLSSLQEEVGKVLAAQMDAYYLCQREVSEENQLRTLYCLHAIQVAVNSRSRIIKHNQVLADAKTKAVSEHRPLKTLDLDGIIERDQGFCRAQTLILAPIRNTAYDIISKLGVLWRTGEAGRQVQNWQRFEDEFGKPEVSDPEEEALREGRDKRPSEFKRLFRDNSDDCFRLGIKFSRKSMKLFADFYSADLIIASPLGLKLLQPNAGPAGTFDFLSSIGFLVVEQADVMAMQNWEHLELVLKHLNCIPQRAHDCDFSRVRTVFLDGHARRVRQSLVMSRLVFPELNAVLGESSSLFTNCMGAVKWQKRGAESIDLLKKLALTCGERALSPSFLSLPMKLDKAHPAEMVAARFEYFTKKLLAPLIRQLDSGALTGGVCIFVSSYFDFCQLRAHLTKTESITPFVHMSDYSSNADISRARSRFFSGLAKIMLITERFHFYRRYRFRGIRRLYFYSLPEYPEFFVELLEMVNALDTVKEEDVDAEKRRMRAQKRFKLKPEEVDVEAGEVACVVSPLDYFKVERIVGTVRAQSILE